MTEAAQQTELVSDSPEALKDWLRPVQDPELNLSLVELGLVYTVEKVGETAAHVKMTLTSPGCPAGPYIMDEIRKRLIEHPNVKDATVEIVWEPKWDPRTMASEECRDLLGIW